jgi:hypothetical protein
MPSPDPHRFDRYREPGLLFGGGLLAGLLLFALWYAFQPSVKAPPPVAAAGAPADTSKPGRKGESVLGDITGEPESGPSRPVSEIEDAQADAGQESDANSSDDPNAMMPGENEPPALSDEEAIAGGLLSDDGQAAPLSTWYVEVMRGPGVSEILEIEATSPDHALSILHDFRGDPRVLRGPSQEPFP